jgi:hypothetical protein
VVEVLHASVNWIAELLLDLGVTNLVVSNLDVLELAAKVFDFFTEALLET